MRLKGLNFSALTSPITLLKHIWYDASIHFTGIKAFNFKIKTFSKCSACNADTGY